MDNRGKIEISFNKEMNFPEYLPALINSRQQKSQSKENRNLSAEKSILEVVLNPARDQLDKNIKFTWNATIPEGVNNQLDLQLIFEKPLEISMSNTEEFDSVEVSIIE
jgi:hypothetical protein